MECKGSGQYLGLNIIMEKRYYYMNVAMIMPNILMSMSIPILRAVFK